MKKPTLATLKSFIKKNKDNLLIKNEYEFDGMTDSNERCNGEFREVEEVSSHSEKLGIQGVWIVGRGRDFISEFNERNLTGFTVSNSCGCFTLAIRI